jgi:hypothetical protein
MTEGDVALPAAARVEGLRRIGERLLAAKRVVLTTHVNSDGDGIVDEADPENHNPCVPNPAAGACDFDGDGLPNRIDPDDDNDGIPDSVEGDDDVDGDGLPNRIDTDSDGDGIPDSQECPSQPCRDTNGDGIPDFLDPANGGNNTNVGPIRYYLPTIQR